MRSPVLLTLSVLWGGALAAQPPSGLLGVASPIHKLQCRSYRSNDVTIEFDDRRGKHFSYLIFRHFVRGDGRVHRRLESGEQELIGMDGEAELLGLLREWSKTRFTEQQHRKLLAATRPEQTPAESDARRNLAAIQVLQSIQDVLVEPLLLRKGAGYFIHAAPSAVPGLQQLGERIIAPGIGLTHTDRTSGRVRYLFPPTATVAVNTVRVSYNRSRLVGVLTDDERLYAVVWRSKHVFQLTKLPRGGTYWLLVFSLADGGKICEVGLAETAVPHLCPQETIRKGPLAVAKDGVSCYGQRYRFEGKRWLR